MLDKIRNNGTTILLLTSYFLLLSACAHAPRSDRPSGGLHRETPEEKTSSDIYFSFLRSEGYALDGYAAKARDELEKVIRANPDIGYLYYERALDELEDKHYESAILDCEKAIELSPKLFQAKLLLAKIYSGLEKHAEAVNILEGLIKEFQDETEAYVLLAREYITLKRYNEAAGTMHRLLVAEVDSNVAHFYLGMLYGSFLNKYDKALISYQKILETDQDNLQIRAAVAQIYLDMGNKKKAVEELLKMEEIDPFDLSVQLKIALLYYQMKRYDDAVKRFENILKFNPESDKIRFYLGVIYAEAGRIESAIENFKKVPTKSDYFKDSNLNVAQFYFAAKNDQEGLDVLKNAIRKKPEEPAFYALLASYYENRNDYKEVSNILAEAVKALPANETVLFGYALSKDRLGDKDEAVEIMQKVLVINPKHARALNYIGYTFVEKGEHLDDAEVMLQEAAEISPNDGYILDSLGWLYFKKGDLTKAVSLLEQAIKMLPNEPEVLEHLGDLHKVKGDKAKSTQYYKRALKIIRGRNPVDTNYEGILQKKISEF